MRVWTDGSTHLVLGPRGLTRHVKGKAETIPLGDAPASPKGQLAWHARGVLAVDPKSKTAWVEWAGKLREVKLDGSAPAKALDWKAKDLAVREDGTAVAVLDAEKGKGKLVAGPVPASGAWKKTLAIPEPAKVKWPAGVVWAKGASVPWSKKKELGHDAYLHANAHGVAIAERSSGIVAVLRPGKAEVDFAVRVPTQDEADLTAAATPEGVLVVVCIEGRNSAVVHVDAKGKVLGTLSKVRTELEEEIAWGIGPPVLVSPTKAFLVHEYTIPQVLDLQLPDLSVETTWELPATSEGEKSIAASEDGKACLLGFGGETWMLTRTASGWQLDELGAAPVVGGASSSLSDEDEAADIDIGAMLKAALGGGPKPAPAPSPSAKKPAKAAKAPAKAVDDDEAWDPDEEREREVKPGAKKKKKDTPVIKELDVEDLGFGALEDEMEDEEEEEEELEAREPGDEDEDGEEAAGGEDDEEEGARKPVKPAAAAPPSRRPSVEGDPALTLVAQAGAPKQWSAKPGASLAIDLGFGNVGGPSKGIFLEVEGGPIGAKKLVPKSVRVGDLEVPFSEPKGNKARVEIKDLSLQAGAANEKAGQPPVPSQVLTVTLQLDAAQPADDLLLVRMGPLRVPRPGAGAFTHGKRLLIAP